MHPLKIGLAVFALGFLSMASVGAHSPPVEPPPGTRAWVEVEPVGVDLMFTCPPHPSGDITYCSPLPGRYGRYVDLANWRMDHAVSMPGTCAYNQTYGYTKGAVWVAGNCAARFMAPNLRYGDQFNHERAVRSYNPAPRRPVPVPCCVAR